MTEKASDPGGHTSSGRGNGKPSKTLVQTIRWAGRCDAVKAGEPQCAAGQVNERDHPAEILEFAQHDLVNEQGRRHPEGNDISQRIEFSSEGTFMTAEARQPSIE